MTVHALPQPDVAELHARRLVLVRPDGMVAWRGDTVPVEVDDVLDIVRGSPVGPNRQRKSMQEATAFRKTA